MHDKLTHTDPIRKSVTVPLPRDDAFDLFARRIDLWWPKDSHSLAAHEEPGKEITVHLEPREGGQVVETDPDGTRRPWADVIRFVPGKRLGLKWYVGRPAEEATYVEVSFTQTDAGTRVDLTHGGFEAFGAEETAMCARYATGWDHVLGHCFAKQCQLLIA